MFGAQIILTVGLAIYFHPMGMTDSIRLGWLSWANWIRWKPAKLFFPRNLSYVYLSAPFLAATLHHLIGEPSDIWTLESTLLDPGAPSWIWIRWIIFASDNSASSFLDNLFWSPSCLFPTATRTTYLWLNIHSCVLKSATQYLPWL